MLSKPEPCGDMDKFRPQEQFESAGSTHSRAEHSSLLSTRPVTNHHGSDRRPLAEHHVDLGRELHGIAGCSNSNSQNVTTNTISNSHNYSPNFYFLYPPGASSLLSDHRTESDWVLPYCCL